MGKENLNLVLDANLKRKIKARAALLGVTVSEVATEFFTKWLDETENQIKEKEGEKS